MPISARVSQDLQFLDDLDVVKFSIRQEGDHLKQINKRSKLCNFFYWVIHYITFTLVPQNRELDRITSHILKEIQDELKEATDKERNLAERAIRNLNIVIKNNGGSQGNAIEKMLATLAKISSLPVVQNLSGKSNEQEDDLLEEEVFDDSLEAEIHTGTKENQLEVPPNTKEIQPDDLLEKEVPEDSLEAEVPSDIQEPQSEAPITINFQEARLQNLLQDLFNQKAFDDEAADPVARNQSDHETAESIAKLLPELQGSAPLSNDQLAVLGKAFELMHNNLMKDLSPGLLACLVKNSLENANLICLCPILIAMKACAEKEQFLAFTYGFKLHRNTLKANISNPEISPKQIEKFLFSFHIFDDKTSFKNPLSEDEMKEFVKNLFEFIVEQTSDDSHEKIKNFKIPLSLSHAFGDQYVQIALKTLCQVKSAKLLTQICKNEKASDFILETILKSNPPKADDSDDSFFQEFVEELMKKIEKLRKEVADDSYDILSAFKITSLRAKEKYVSTIAKYVFANECEERQKILASKLSPGVIALQLESIPAEAWMDIHESILLEVARELSYQKRASTSALQAFANGLGADRLYDFIDQDSSYRKFWSSLLPLCTFPTQVQFVSKVINSGSYDHRQCLKKIQPQLDLKVWEEASKQNLLRNYRDISSKDYSPETLAHIVNGQINNQMFFQDFFESYFEENGDLEKQKTCVAHLKPEVFKFFKPEEIPHSTWYKLFKALREIHDQTHAQNLLIRSTLHLFNSPGFNWLKRQYVYTLTEEQMELLPIQQYKKPEIRLLLACLTNRLDDQLLDTANSLYNQGSENFLNFFRPAYSERNLENMDCFVFKKDIQLLKNFLLWVLNRPSIAPVLPTWTWINESYQGQVILQCEIQDDTEIQGHIKRLNLSVNK